MQPPRDVYVLDETPSQPKKKPSAAAKKAAPPSLSWLGIVADSFAYPDRRGWLYLIPWQVPLMWLRIGFRHPFALVYIFLLFPLCLCINHVSAIEHTVTGVDEPPDWPSPDDSFSEFFMPLISCLASAMVCFAPLPIYLGLARSMGGNSHVALCLLGWAVFAFPMTLLSYLRRGTVGSLMPQQVLPAIAVTLFGYVCVVGLYVAVAALMVWALMDFHTNPWLAAITSFTLAVRGPLILGRVLGLFHRRYRDILGW